MLIEPWPVESDKKRGAHCVGGAARSEAKRRRVRDRELTGPTATRACFRLNPTSRYGFRPSPANQSPVVFAASRRLRRCLASPASTFSSRLRIRRPLERFFRRPALSAFPRRVDGFANAAKDLADALTQHIGRRRHDLLRLIHDDFIHLGCDMDRAELLKSLRRRWVVANGEPGLVCPKYPRRRPQVRYR